MVIEFRNYDTGNWRKWPNMFTPREDDFKYGTFKIDGVEHKMWDKEFVKKLIWWEIAK